MTVSKRPKKTHTAPANKPAKPASNGHAELSEAALDQASGGSFSWAMQDTQLCDGSVRTNVATPSLLLPAVKPAG